MKDSSKRISNIELLRIIAMLMIVIAHSVFYGCQFVEKNTLNLIILSVFRSGAKIGVNCFIIITGYFLIESNRKKIKLIKIIISVFLYSILGFGINILILHQFTLKEMIASFLPLTFNQYWFATSYVLLYLLFPYLNTLLNNLKLSEYRKMLILLFVLWSVIPTITTKDFGMNSLLWFFFLYSVGAYIKKIKKTECYTKLYKHLKISAFLSSIFLK